MALSVIGGQVLVVVAAANEESVPTLLTGSNVSLIAQGAGATVAVGRGSNSEVLIVAVSEAAVAPGPSGAPVSSTSGGTPPPTRVKVNFGQTFRVESKVLEWMVIEPVDAL